MSDQAAAPGSVGAPAEAPTDNDRLMAALGYIIGVIVPLIILLGESKNRPFQRYHAIQSLGLTAAIVIYTILVTILSCIIGMIPVLQVLACVIWVLYLLPAVPVLYYAYQSYQGQMFEIPWLTQFMRQQKWL